MCVCSYLCVKCEALLYSVLGLTLNIHQCKHLKQLLFTSRFNGEVVNVSSHGLNIDENGEKQNKCQCRHHQNKRKEKHEQSSSFLEAKRVFKSGKYFQYVKLNFIK